MLAASQEGRGKGLIPANAEACRYLDQEVLIP